MGRDADGEIRNHEVRTKTEERQANEGPKSPKKKISVCDPFEFVEKNHNKKSLEGRIQTNIQTAIDGTEKTVKNRYRKSKTPKIQFRTSVSNREEEPKRYGNIKCQNHPQKPSLPERVGRKVRPMGWDTARHPQRQTEDPKPEDKCAGNRR